MSYEIQPQFEARSCPPGGIVHQLDMTCPFCGGRRLYKLGDGRRKCRDCRRRFTPNPMGSRLDQSVLEKLPGLFWDLVPAEEASLELGLNRKTVQRYYRKMRRAIADYRPDSSPDKQTAWTMIGFFQGYWRVGGLSNDLAGVFPVFGLARLGRQVRVIMAQNRADYTRLDANSMRLATADGEAAGDGANGGQRLAREFWNFARPRLGAYHGGWKANLPMFLQEMEFRFNFRNSPGPPDLLRLAL